MIENLKTNKDYMRESTEDKLLAKLHIKCKECDARMSTGRQEGKRFYYCGNNTGHKDNLDRYVWVEMPEWLEGELDTELSSEKKAD